MTRYDTGRFVEHRVREHLVNDGYVVIRAAGSKGKIDLNARKPGQLLDIQCKGDGVRFSGADWDRLRELASWVGAIPILGTRDTVNGCQELHSSVKCGTVLWELTGPYVLRGQVGVQPRVLFRTDLYGEAAS
jgi:Holliday junction resolvase